jgi:hypothetical protein
MPLRLVPEAWYCRPAVAMTTMNGDQTDMRREGTLHIVWVNRGHHGDPKYHVAFADYAASQRFNNFKEVEGEEVLRDYLTAKIKVHPAAVDTALHRLKAQGNAGIFHTILLDEQLVKLGLR